MVHIKIITPDNAESFWQLRLEGLLNSPENFGSTYEEDSVRPMEAVRARVTPSDSSFILGAYTEEGQLVGNLGFKREQSIKLKHKGFLWGMYVKPAYRGQGIGELLLVNALEKAKSGAGLEQINLCVVTSNDSAKRLYESVGFVVYGCEKNALKYNDRHYDEFLMSYRIK